MSPVWVMMFLDHYRTVSTSPSWLVLLGATQSFFITIQTKAPRGTDRSPEYNEHLLKVRFLSKSESMTVKFVKSIRTANNHNISIQNTWMHSVCCCYNPIWRRSPLEKWPLIDPFLCCLGSISERICPKSLNACVGPWLLNSCQVL